MLHPPAVYDFRKRPEFLGPISDVVPSTPVFEMYPVGMTCLADYIEERGYDVQLVNLAYGMVRDDQYDPSQEIAACPAWAFAIDLHWLPHAHGAIEVAREVKRHHPETPVILGGLSATYYHEELITYDCVDYVVRGDSTREPMAALVEALEDGDPDPAELADVPNLTWRDDGETVVTPLDYVPEDLDFASVPSYSYIIRSVMKYGSLQKVLPHRGWLDDPMTMLLVSRGCTHDCSFCGGAASSYRDVCNRQAPAFRSPERLREDIRSITSFSEGPIFVVNDIRMGGPEYAERVLELLAEEDVDNEFIFELFRPADADFFERIDDAVDSYSLEFSIESHDREVREQVGKFDVPNAAVERTLEAAAANGCRSADLFFMIGLPRQTDDSVLASVDYAGELLDRFEDGWLQPFIAPLAPFLDPGSPAFEDPDEYGYTLLRETFEEHRQALLEPGWKYKLSYETDWLSRDEIVGVTYEASERLNDLKHEHGVVDDKTHRQVKRRITASQQLVGEIDEVYHLPPDEREAELRRRVAKLDALGEYSICGEDELSWSNEGLRDLLTLGRVGLSEIWSELRRRYGSAH